MKYKESRVGNYCRRFDGTINDYIIHTISLFDFEYISRAGGDFSDYGFDPIPLNEEWLLKFGFVRTNDSNIVFEYKKNKLELNSTRSNNDIFSFYWGDVTDIKYIHHLQNLYFYLIGKELEIKQ